MKMHPPWCRLCLVACCVLASPLHAVIDEWTTHGPFGGDVGVLVVDPRDPDTLYAGTSLGGLFRSTDGAGSWSSLGAGLSFSVYALAIDPRDPDTFYAGTPEGLYKSTDNARLWRRVRGGLPAESVLAVAIDPADPAIVYAGSRSMVYKSTDGADTWAAAGHGLEELNGLIYDLVFDPRDPLTLYAGTGDGVYKTSDGAASWDAASDGLPSNRLVSPLVIDPAGVLYVSGDGGVYKSTDGALTWTAASQGLHPNYDPRALVFDPRDARILYAGCTNGVYRTTDGGAHWIAVGGGQPLRVDSLAIDPTRPEILYAGTSIRGVYKSSDGGVTWELAHHGLTASRIRALAADPGDPDVVYAGTDEGVQKSVDGGATWNVVDRGLSGAPVEALAIDPADPAVLYAGTWGGVFKSVDGGAEWVRRSGGLSHASLHALAIDGSNPDVVYAGSERGLYKTTDGAAHWFFLADLGDPWVLALAIDPLDGRIVYAGTSDGVFKSTDGGATWHKASVGLPGFRVESLVIHPTRPAILYAGVLGVYKTVDGAATWSRTGRGVPATNVYSLAIDPRSPDRLYAGPARLGVSRSSNGGDDWHYMSFELPGSLVAVDELVIPPEEPRRLYAGTRSRGVWTMNRSLCDLGNRVWFDADGHGLQDPGEPGAGGVEVRLLDADGALLASTVTEPSGFYSFLDLEPGDVTLEFRALPGLAWCPARRGDDPGADSDVDPRTGRTPRLTLVPGARDFDLDAGLTLPPPPRALDLHDGRFRVEITWRDFEDRRGMGTVASVPWTGDEVPLASEDSAALRFFHPDNWEMMVKVLDGRQLTGHFWVYLAAATNLGFRVTVTDTSCGDQRTYSNPLGVSAPATTDTTALPGCDDPAPPSCVAGEKNLCLGAGGRFRVEAEWWDFGGHRGPASQVMMPHGGLARSDDSGIFQFFGNDNWEILVKVLDGCGFNDHFWVFGCATTDVEYTLTVTDTHTGVVRSYENPLGSAAGALNDVEAFATCSAGS